MEVEKIRSNKLGVRRATLKKLRVRRETLKKLGGKVRTGVRAGRSLICTFGAGCPKPTN